MKSGLLPPRDKSEELVAVVNDKVLVDVGSVRIELELADALALASKIICVCEVVERGRHSQATSGS